MIGKSPSTGSGRTGEETRASRTRTPPFGLSLSKPRSVPQALRPFDGLRTGKLRPFDKLRMIGESPSTSSGRTGEEARACRTRTPPFGLSLSKPRSVPQALRPFDGLRAGKLRPFDKLRMIGESPSTSSGRTGEGTRASRQRTPPFGLSLSKPRSVPQALRPFDGLRAGKPGPFDKLRMIGKSPSTGSGRTGEGEASAAKHVQKRHGTALRQAQDGP